MSENETPSMPKLTYSLGRLAVLLAMSENREEENLWKELITKQNYKCVATEVSGTRMTSLIMSSKTQLQLHYGPMSLNKASKIYMLSIMLS